MRQPLYSGRFSLSAHLPPHPKQAVLGQLVHAEIGRFHLFRQLFREAQLHEAGFRVDDGGGEFALRNAFRFVHLYGMHGPYKYGADIIDNLISGITSMFSNLTSTVSDAASIIADFLHFSEPEKGPLSDFNESGADMIQNYIESMQSQRTALENALADTAGLIASDFDSDFNVATDSNVHQTVDYTGGLSRIEQAITSQAAAVGADGATIVIPVYLGNELIDTVVVDAVDRYNYSTGGH